VISSFQQTTQSIHNFLVLKVSVCISVTDNIAIMETSVSIFRASLRRRPRSQAIGHWCDRSSSDVITYRLTSFSQDAKCFPSSTVVAILRTRISMHTVRMRRTATVTASPEPVFTLNVNVLYSVPAMTCSAVRFAILIDSIQLPNFFPMGSFFKRKFDSAP